MSFRRLVLFSCLYLSACTSFSPIISPDERTKLADRLARSVGWHEQRIHTTRFTLKTYGPPVSKRRDKLTVYIEGDGLAWLSSDTPSNNPTPLVATGLQMAIHDHDNDPVVYLARPCQFLSKEEWGNCRTAYWTHWRFSPDVIKAMNQAVDQLKDKYHAKRIHLVGYSGGGTIATLMATRRTDVVQLTTFAAILDTDFWVHQQHLTPLYGSLNPADEWQHLSVIPQTHWVGGKDNVASPAIALAFAKRFPATKKPDIRIVPTFDHHCCWTGNQSDSIKTENSCAKSIY